MLEPSHLREGLLLMDILLHRSSSIGGLIKKITELNPDLGTHEIIGIVRQATRLAGENAGDYRSLEIVDEKIALELTEKSLKKTTH